MIYQGHYKTKSVINPYLLSNIYHGTETMNKGSSNSITACPRENVARGRQHSWLIG